MHKKEKKKKPPHFVTGVTEMDDGYVRTRHVQKKKKKKPWKYCCQLWSCDKCENKYLKDLLTF